MAVQRPLDFDAFPAGADLSSKQYYLAKINSSGQAVLAGDGELAYGSIDEPAASGKTVTLAIAGLVKVIAGGVVATGAPVTSDGNGKAVEVGSGDRRFGIARKGGAADTIIEVLVDRN